MWDKKQAHSNTAHSHKGTDTARVNVTRLVKGTERSSNFVSGSDGCEIDWVSGNVEFNDGYFRGDISAATGTFTASIAIGTSPNWFKVDANGNCWSGAPTFAVAPFSISNAGALIASSATVTGSITATSGAIGGWTINATSITDTAGVVGLSSAVTGGDDIRFWAGDATPGSAEFRVTEAGALTATSATITGAVTATSGAIGGWTINATSIYTGTEDHSGYTANAGDLTIYSNGTDASIHAKNWYIDTTGALYCTSATVSGAITTTAGSSIVTDYLSGLVAQANLNVANRGWTQTSAFSITDADTVAWGAGTFTASDGTAYSIDAGNTGNMAAKTYIYLDTAVSTTAYQTTTTSTTAVGVGKVLIAIAQNAVGEATYMVMQGQGGLNIDAANIVVGTVTTNEIAASTIVGANIATLAISGKSCTFDTGTVGGWTMGATSLTNVSGGNTVTLSTGATAFLAGPTGAPTCTITTAGVLSATGATISGALTATSGAIGGWTINATSITDTAGVVGMSSAVTVGDDIRFWAGHATPASAPFKVTEAGALTATSATISGSITSTSGTIGGFTLAANLLSSGTDNDYVGISSDGTNAFWAGDSTFADAEFSVTAAGVLKATSATITGAITASSGSIGSFTIGTYLYTGTKTAYNDANAGVHLGSDGIGIGNNIFTVSSAGALVATSATITGAINATSGKIGTATDYWSIGATGITAVSAGTDVIINYGKTDFTNVDTGFILGYDFSATKAKFYIGSSTDYFNFDGTNALFRTTLADAITIDSGSNILLQEGGSVKFTSVTAPTACTATLIETGTGNVDNGTHSYKVTYVTATGETELGATSNVVTVDGTHKQVDLSAIPTSSSSAVTSRKIYRTKAGGSYYYLLTTIANNSGTIYTDNTADASLDADDATNRDNYAFGKIVIDSKTSVVIGISNTFIGQEAGLDNTVGWGGTALGRKALYDNTTGVQNTAVGLYALMHNTTGDYNAAFGGQALAWNTTGDNNTAVGYNTLFNNQGASNNTSVGYHSLFTNQDGSGNVALGYMAGYYATGSNEFYLDNQDRTNNAGEKTKSLMYGVFNALPANQTLTINAALTATTYSGLTLTAAAAGFTIAGGTTSKTLTVPLDASVSGTNTGDQTLSGLGGAPNTATFLTATAETGLSAEVNLGALSTGLLKGTVAAGVSTISAITDNSTNWNTAYDWGNHASAGYLTSVTAHNLLSATHGDTTTSACARGSVIVGDVNTKWVNLAFPATPTGKVLIATATDVAWSTSALGTAAYTASTAYAPALGADDNYVTDAEKIVIGNTSGTNTGDASGHASLQPLDSTLTSIALLGTAADKIAYTTNIDTWAETTCTAFARSILDDADEATFKATVNLEIGTDVQAYNVTLAAVAGGTYAGDDSIVTVGTITAGVWTGTDIAVADGGTGLGAVAAGSILAANAANVLSAVTSASGTKYLKNAAGTISWDTVSGPIFTDIAPPMWTAPTNATTWEDWNLSASIPAGATYAEVQMYVYNNNYSGGVRVNGGAVNRLVTPYDANIAHVFTLTVALDANRIVERYASNVTYVKFTVSGYWS